jgi:hypothetical protein
LVLSLEEGIADLASWAAFLGDPSSSYVVGAYQASYQVVAGEKEVVGHPYVVAEQILF